MALISHLTKVFEKVIRKCNVSHLEENKLLNKNQLGFHTSRACLSQLLTHFDRIMKHVEEGKNVLYLDFEKAFDKIDFLITMQKLK